MVARVLVVDDLMPNIKLLQAKLESEYYEVVTAQSGKEALDVIAENAPDIVLLDVMMPEMDGFEVCKFIKNDVKTADIPVVMVTALSEVEDRVQGLKAGADDFLTKPINDLALFARIRSLVRLKNMTDELKLRDQTEQELGNEEEAFKATKYVDGGQVLIIDDDQVQANNAAEKLIEKGYIVDMMSEPEELAMPEKDYDMIIVSTQMTHRDGLQLCAHFRRHENTRHIPLLITLEENNTELLVRGLDMGINDYVTTPIDANELLARTRVQLKRKRYQEALKNTQKEKISMAVTDGLTGLHNRHYFDTHIGKMIDACMSKGRKISLIILDIDHFKNINDTYGHISGDEILKQLPKRITSNIRASDLAARYGGEEFVVVMPKTSLGHAAEVAERIRKAVEKAPFLIPADEGKIECTISVGVATASEGDTAESLLEKADKALYHVKETGRNKVVAFSEAPAGTSSAASS